jgi:hypothetical protein
MFKILPELGDLTPEVICLYQYSVHHINILIKRNISVCDVCGYDLNLFAVFTNCFESSLSEVHLGLDIMQMVDVPPIS